MFNSAPIIADLTTKLKDRSVQSSPDCFVRFVRFRRRDTRDYKEKKPLVKVQLSGRIDRAKGIRHGKQFAHSNTEALTNADIVDVMSDVIACTVDKSKASPIGSFTVILSPADINYHHVLNPGDHAMIWMRRQSPQGVTKTGALGPKSMYNNDIDSGLKMYGIITDVRRIFATLPDGKKMLRYRVQGTDFGYFFNASVYYNATLASDLKDTLVIPGMAMALYRSARGLSTNKAYGCGSIVNLLLTLYIGTGLPDILGGEDATAKVRSYSPNSELLIPKAVASMFRVPGHRSAKVFSDILNRRVSVENYGENRLDPIKKRVLPGLKEFKIEVGSQYKLWSVLRTYSNASMNEMFIDLKPVYYDKDKREEATSSGSYKLQPTFVLRQIPFSTVRAHHKLKDIPTTRFVELPRIRIPELFILSENIGRSSSERFNFIELFGSYPGMPGVNIPLQIAQGNYAIDYGSIKRYGLRALIPKTDYYIPKEGDTQEIASLTLIPKWIRLLADWWLGAHTLETGTFSLVGIEEALSLGDNIEIDRKNGVNELYHVEHYSHSYSVSPTGEKSFKTTVDVTRGQRVDELPVYASGRYDEEDILDIGLTDSEPAGMARPNNPDAESGLSKVETIKDRKKAIADEEGE